MTTFHIFCLLLCLLGPRTCDSEGTFVNVPPNGSIQSVAEKETVLPCAYQPGKDNKVIQVTWSKKTGDKFDDIVIAHETNGQMTFGSWAQRVAFKSSKPFGDSSLAILSTDLSDEGTYKCHIAVFPTGNFYTQVNLVVLTTPITSLTPTVVVEGQPEALVATCRSSAVPTPSLSWDTKLPGKSDNRSFSTGVTTIQYRVNPLKNMNGKKLDCLVWHPTYATPQRIQNNVEVQFAPSAQVSGYDNNWYLGAKYVTLTCVSEANPKPNFTWTKTDGNLPKGATSFPNGTLLFGQPLTAEDGGTYQCEAVNSVGEKRAEVTVSLKDPPLLSEVHLMSIVGVASGLLLLMVIIVVAVTCGQKRKNRRLKKTLEVKNEEIKTLSRQPSIRKVNSVSTDAGGPPGLKVVGTLNHSRCSLGDVAQCRDSRSTISWGHSGRGYESLDRPIISSSSRRHKDRGQYPEDETRRRLEEYVRSTCSLKEAPYQPPLMAASYSVGNSVNVYSQVNGGAMFPRGVGGGGSRQGSLMKNHQPPLMSFAYAEHMDDEDEVDEGLGGPASQEHQDDPESGSTSSRMSEAQSSQRSKVRTTPILMGPHASEIHKAQIV